MSSRRVALAPPWRDVALAAFFVLFVSLVTRHIQPSSDLTAGNRGVDALTYVCIAVSGAALAMRQRTPVAVVAVVTGALLVYLVRGYPGGPVYLTWYVALFSLALVRQRTVGFLAAGASSVALFAAGVVANTGPRRLVHLVFIAWAAAAVLLGDAVRSRRERVAAIEERAHRLEQSREDEARRRVAEERLRIARDLHDSVAHTMATINVHAGAAAHVIDRRPDEARSSLRVVQRASREVLEELTAMLQLLRFDGDAPARVPAAGLGQLDGLVESVRRAGVEVVLDREPVTVTQPVDGAAYRIVQESLTNVIRHGGRPVTATVRVHGGADGLLVEVSDDGAGGAATSTGTGVGIVGMRERAEATGGSFEAGPREGGGFRIRASWPGRP